MKEHLTYAAEEQMDIQPTEHPNPAELYPIQGITRTCYLKNIITNPQIIVGDYTYYDDPDSVYNFEKNVLYLFDFIKDRLIIGKFCQIATGVQFIMNGANHSMDGVSTYPFKVFGKSWGRVSLNPANKGGTIIGNDVWIGKGAHFMPGVTVGDGAIIGTNSLVIKDVAPYTIVGGNPADLIRKRFDDETTSFLLRLKWWDWPVEKISQHVESLSKGDIVALAKICLP